jgi:hypothetical protein
VRCFSLTWTGGGKPGLVEVLREVSRLHRVAYYTAVCLTQTHWQRRYVVERKSTAMGPVGPGEGTAAIYLKSGEREVTSANVAWPWAKVPKDIQGTVFFGALYLSGRTTRNVQLVYDM